MRIAMLARIGHTSHPEEPVGGRVIRGTACLTQQRNRPAIVAVMDMPQPFVG